MMQAAQDKNSILRKRAMALARELETPAASEGFLELVEFRLAGEYYAIEQTYVREVHPLKDLTPLPCTPPFVLGIINVRGQILPVIDIKRFFDLPETGITDLHTVIIFQSGGIELGIMADTVTGVRSIPLNALQTSLPTLTGIRAEYLKGVTDQHVAILDVCRILADPKIEVNEEVGT